MNIKQDVILSAISALGLAGRPVCIHSSLKSFGACVEGGAQMILDCFLEQGCTIMTFSATGNKYKICPPKDMRPERNGVDYAWLDAQEYGEPQIYHPDCNDINREEMGVIPYTLLHMPSRLRGKNPLHPFAAIGPLAEELISGQTAQNIWAPLEKLCKLNGALLLMGVNLDRATILHYAEQVAGREPFVRWAYDSDGNPAVCRLGGCSRGFNHFDDIVKPIEKDYTVGKSQWRCFKASELVENCASAMKQNPHISHCGNSDCIRCDDAVLGGPILSTMK
jgi:aminoglycoside N3'-acetyltransferase